MSAEILAGISDRRPEPRIPTACVLPCVLVLFWARLGSLNALEMAGSSRFWKRWLGRPLCSADTIGRVHSLVYVDQLRAGIHHLYEGLKRNKALPDIQGIGVAVLDGHESHASYRRHCSGCLERSIKTEQGERTQYYHRHVTLLLVPDAPAGRPPVRLLLDHEPQRVGDDEVATALRLLGRVIPAYPRAFDLVLADGLYVTAPFFNFLLARRKHCLAVLKDERRNLFQDVAGLFDYVSPQPGCYGSRQCLWWDFPDRTSWPQVEAPVRVVRSLETYSVRRQLDGIRCSLSSEWIWVTTLPFQQVPTARVVALGHQRWDIENHGFNELVNGWHADHVFKHEPHAMECFLLMAFLAFNIFQAILSLNLKPQLRQGRTRAFWASLMAAEIYQEVFPASLSP